MSAIVPDSVPFVLCDSLNLDLEREREIDESPLIIVVTYVCIMLCMPGWNLTKWFDCVVYRSQKARHLPL